MHQQTYSFDAAAARLNTGRNTLIRQLRELGMLDANNLPAGRERGGPNFIVRTGSYQHPFKGLCEYARTEVTEQGLRTIARRLGHPACRSAAVTPWIGVDMAAGPDRHQPQEEPTMQQPTALPEGTLHDIGELTVVTPDGERINHRAAMVVVFDSPGALQRAIDAHRCAYHIRPDLPEAQLHPEQLARQA